MANHRGRGRGKPASNPQGVQDAYEWFANVNSDVTGVAEWDIRSELLAETVLSLLAADVAIMFGRTWDGDEIVVRLFDGDHKPVRKARDAVEFEDILSQLRERARARVSALEPPVAREPNQDYVPGYKRKTAGEGAPVPPQGA